MKRSTGWLIGAVCSTIASLLQGIGLARYVGRLPDDWVGIGLYAASIIGFALVAVGFYVRWVSEKHTEESA